MTLIRNSKLAVLPLNLLLLLGLFYPSEVNSSGVGTSYMQGGADWHEACASVNQSFLYFEILGIKSDPNRYTN